MTQAMNETNERWYSIYSAVDGLPIGLVQYPIAGKAVLPYMYFFSPFVMVLYLLNTTVNRYIDHKNFSYISDYASVFC